MDREQRALKIEDAAYKVLEEKGFKGASMLAVARAAKASNETLYNWYGDKVGLFSALVERNSKRVAERLAEQRDARGVDALRAVGETLLDMLTGPRAIALNRAAAADPSGELGRAIAKGGRDMVAPMLAEMMSNAVARGDIAKADSRELTETYLALLVGDLQIRRAIGVLDAPDAKEITARTDRAVTQLLKLYPPD